MSNYLEFPKIDAMRKKCDPNDWYWFSRDITNVGQKAFTAIKKDSISEYLDYFNVNNYLYEILPPEQPVCPYFDLEIEIENYDGLLVKFQDWLDIIWETEFGFRPTYIVLNSCRENKLSYHLIINNCYFNNVFELKGFVHWLFDLMIKTPIPELCWKYGDEQRLIFDKVPYGNNQSLRMINQSKRGKQYILKGDYIPFDTFVRNTRGVLLQATKYKKNNIPQNVIVCPENQVETSGFDEKQTIYYEEFQEYMKYNLFTKFSINATFEEWRNFGFGIYNTFGENGLQLFLDFCKLDMKRYKEDENIHFYKKLTVGGSNRITFNTIRMWAKKADSKMFKRIFSIFIDKLEERQYADNDNEASDIIIELLNNKLINGNKVYYKTNNVWICDGEMIKSHLINYIMSSPLYKEDAKSNATLFWANYSSAEKVYKTIMNKIMTFPCVVDKFHSTTKYRLCFMNGVLDFKTKKFYTWKEIDFEYYSVVQIPYNYERVDYQMIIDAVLQPLFNDKLDLALQYLARSIAGCIEDKNFSTYEGNRNCGKGAIGHLLGAFGDYIKPLLLSNVTCSRETSHESAKDLYWLMDYEFARLAISQEVPVEGLKLRSDMIKRICSGGDTHTARRNYDRHDTNFQVECSVMMMGNEKIIVEGDLNEHYIEFNSAVQFKSQEFIDALDLEEDAKKKYRLADPDIKSKCDSPLWYLAMVNCLFDAFVNKPIVMDYVTEEASVIQQILTKYVITKDKNDIVLASDFDEFGTKAKPELKVLGIEYKKCKNKSLRDKLCFFGIKLKS
jgi:hypothetical protein